MSLTNACCRRSPALASSEVLTENPMLPLACPSREAALQVFALLSSKLAFWWWHAHGDGFHVSKHIVETMPVGEAFRSAEFTAELTRLGDSLWGEISASPVVSRNRGRTSLGFSAAASPHRTKIDSLLIKALRLAPEFAGELDRFCEGVTNATISPPNEPDNQRTNPHDLHAVG